MPAGPEPITATFLPVLCAWRLRLDPALLEGAVGDRAFDRLDGDRIVVDVERAGRLARRRADAAGDLREIVGRVQVARGLFPVAAIDEVVPVRDLVVDRAAGRRAGDGVGAVAIGNAAVHAARRLLADVLLGQREDEFACSCECAPRPAGNRRSCRSNSRKPGDLTHRCHARASLRFRGLGGFERFEFGERAAVLDRHHLAELRADSRSSRRGSSAARFEPV